MKAVLVLLAAIMVALLLAFYPTQAALYSLTTEPPGGFEATPNFPVSDTNAPIEFAYATPDTPLGWGEAIPREVIIIMDLQNTNLRLSNCFIGNGQLLDWERLEYNNHLVVKSITVTGQFFSVLCTTITPAAEQDATTTTAYIYEVDTSYTIVDPTVANPATKKVSLKQVAEDILGPEMNPAPRISQLAQDSVTKPTMSSYGSDSSVQLPPIFTRQEVFSFTYKFTAGERKLLNDTELDLLRESHLSYITDHTRTKTKDDILILDHYADVDNTGKVQYIYVTLYTKYTTSQYDFKLGLQNLQKPNLASWTVPLELASLTHSTDKIYRSNCFNSKQDFSETSVNCGDPTISECSHCYTTGSVCTQDSQCALGQCTKDGICLVEYGTRTARRSSAVVHFTLYTMVALIVASLFLM